MLYNDYDEGDMVVESTKATNAEKDAFMKWQLSRKEQIHELYQVKIKESKTAVAMSSTGNEKSGE